MLFISDLVTSDLVTSELGIPDLVISHLASSGISVKLTEAGIAYLLSSPDDGVFALG